MPRSIAEILETELGDKKSLIEAGNNLSEEALGLYGEKGIETTFILVFEKQDGYGTVVVVKNGTIVDEPLQMGVVAGEVADKVRMCAANTERAR